jgi:transposase
MEPAGQPLIHIAAVTQLRLNSDGRAYYRRKRAEGKKPLEALRCLKRRISDALHRQLVADAAVVLEGQERGPGRALRGVTCIQRGRLAPAHRHFGSATSRTRTHDATREHVPCEPPPGPAPQPPRRRAGAVKVQRPTGRTTLSATSRRTLHRADPGPLDNRRETL